jgi:Na+/H+ antiporter NhaD/arsenite permease-like protein
MAGIVSPGTVLHGAVAKDRAEVGFLEYFRVGLPLTLVTVLLGWLILISVPA